MHSIPHFGDLWWEVETIFLKALYDSRPMYLLEAFSFNQKFFQVHPSLGNLPLYIQISDYTHSLYYFHQLPKTLV